MASLYSGGRASRYAAQFGTRESLLTPEEQAAKNAGFASVADQMANRMMRNQLEEKAMRLGVSLQDAYALAGGDLTNTQALQNAWNQLKAPPAPPAASPPPPAPPTAAPPAESQPDPGPSASDIAIQKLNDQIASLTTGFQSQLADQKASFENIISGQEDRMTGLTNMLIQSQAQAQQQNRPTVAGVQTATGSSGTPMQIARRGVSGTFGRRGMRIQSLNV